MDVATCKCTCTSDLYTGDLCEINRCPGVTCINGATLDVDTCQCICRDEIDNCENYIGDFCKARVCFSTNLPINRRISSFLDNPHQIEV